MFREIKKSLSNKSTVKETNEDRVRGGKKETIIMRATSQYLPHLIREERGTGPEDDPSYITGVPIT